ncbi:TPA: MBL fold metallo-hydrolase [Candidatus Bipolaricaulota bacterium]|nr:MBL fold metallo-hydrolase [Candidatus Bipolaricaulota bacterium]
MKRGRGIGGEARLLLHRGELEGLRLFSPGLEPDRFLEEGDSLPFGRGREGLSLKVLHTPGHSPGSLVFMVDRGLFVGDLVFSGSIGRTDLPGGSPREMERSLRRIIELEGDFRIFPGHGPETTLSRERVSNPFLRELQVRWPPERS